MARRPPSATARSLARQVLRRVELENGFVSQLLDEELLRTPLAEPDRRLATELIYGVLRHRSRIDRAIAGHARRGQRMPARLREILRVGAYQILALDRVPDHAAVSEAVDAAKALGGPRLGGFANAILRALVRSGEPPLPAAESDPLGYLEVAHSLPRWMLQVLEARLPAGELAEAAAALSRPAPLVARVNLDRCRPEELQALLAEEGAQAAPHPLVDGALIVTRLGDLRRSPSFQRGLWTAQDAAAQLVGHLAAPQPGQRVLDACSGVGGKSTHLAALAQGGAAITAVDLSPRKLALLAEAAARLGARGIEPVVGDVAEFAASDRVPSGGYDAVLLDAPCTGLGVVRRHPEAKWRVQPGQVRELAALQARLLDAVAPLVRPGGTLVYAVCTITPEEGPGQVAAFCGRWPQFRPAGPAAPAGSFRWQVLLDDQAQLSIWPHRHEADGFFAARLRRCTPGETAGAS
jgi:16S rRNA (cytosine967-C5)-methyltransferase